MCSKKHLLKEWMRQMSDGHARFYTGRILPTPPAGWLLWRASHSRIWSRQKPHWRFSSFFGSHCCTITWKWPGLSGRCTLYPGPCAQATAHWPQTSVLEDAGTHWNSNTLLRGDMVFVQHCDSIQSLGFRFTLQADFKTIRRKWDLKHLCSSSSLLVSVSSSSDSGQGGVSQGLSSSNSLPKN